jgi:hypothetical protein
MSAVFFRWTTWPTVELRAATAGWAATWVLALAAVLVPPPAAQLEPLPRIPPATLSAVQCAESLLGAALPDLLRRLDLEVSNGGFGPAYGIVGRTTVSAAT